MNATSTASPKMMADKDRRRSARKPHAVQAWIASPTARNAEEREEVTSVNVSKHGIAFERKTALPTGTYHILDISIAGQRSRSEVRILSCRKRDNGRYEIGGEFV